MKVKEDNMSDKSNTPTLEFNGLVKKVDGLMSYDRIDDKYNQAFRKPTTFSGGTRKAVGE